ncbi:MAG: hypothetical protein COA47_10185 [Robiginitomaculum sp.]|nr:MAG: hypothetical protein COA47_10185 [Robiginitomaculum sp.]
MNGINEYLKIIGHRAVTEIAGELTDVYKSREDGSYICHATEPVQSGLLKFLNEHGVNKVYAIHLGGCAQIGFSKEENKWYGWGRGIYGFGIGSEVERGDCAYNPVDKDDFLKSIVEFWSDEHRINVRGEHRADGVYVSWTYAPDTPNEKVRGQISGVNNQYPDEYGKGEWTALTLNEARQMAIDYSNGVS